MLAVEYKGRIENIQDMLYVLDVQVGTPPKAARLIFDTGSSDMWIKSSAFDPSESSTATIAGNRVYLAYGKGSVSGTQAFDRVCFAKLVGNRTSLLNSDAAAAQAISLVSSNTFGLINASALNAFGVCDLDAFKRYVLTPGFKQAAEQCYQSSCSGMSSRAEAWCCEMGCVVNVVDAKFPDCSGLVDEKWQQLKQKKGCNAIGPSAAPSTTTLCSVDQALLSADSVTDIGNDAFYDGLVGAAFPALSNEGETTFLQKIQQSGSFNKFGFALSLGDYFSDEKSYVTFGEVTDLIQEAPGGASAGVELDVIGNSWSGYNYWVVPTVVKLGGTTMSKNLFLDSGTSLLAMPSDDFEVAFAYMVPSHNSDCKFMQNMYYVCACNATVEPLIFSFTDIGGTAKQIFVSIGKDSLFLPLGAGSCMLALMPGPSFSSMWILGDAFMRHVYAVHNPVDYRVTLFPRAMASLATEKRPTGDVPALPLVVGIAALTTLVATVSFWTRWRRRGGGVTLAAREAGEDAYIRL
jgi:hypothetical protein